jgi:hypothetical protein
MDYSERMGVMAITGGNDPSGFRISLAKRRPCSSFSPNRRAVLGAERDGEIVAYARSVEHDGLQELTEFFVSPVNSRVVSEASCCRAHSPKRRRAIVRSSLHWMSALCIGI